MDGSSKNFLRLGGFTALFGALFLAVGIVWLYTGSETIEWTSTLPGTVGMFLVTGSLLCLYPFIAKEGGSGGVLWATTGVAVVLLSLVAILLVVVAPAPDGVSRLLTAGWVIVFWIRPLGMVLFAFSLVRSDILFGRALLLFAISFTELPLLANIASMSDAAWPMLLFGIPDLQPGMISALLWAGFGYSLLLLGGKEIGGDARESGIPPLIRP